MASNLPRVHYSEQVCCGLVCVRADLVHGKGNKHYLLRRAAVDRLKNTGGGASQLPPPRFLDHS
eukprot:6177943-Pleurochrysis_carterae.AAC.4